MYYLHIGIAKTATTTVQVALNGLSGPVRQLPIGRQDEGNHGIAAAVLGDRSPTWLAPYSMDQLRSDMASLKPGDYIASSEAMGILQFMDAGGPKLLSEIFNPATVIMYVRNQIDLFNSSYLQYVKTGFELQNIYEHYESWKKVRRGNMYDTAMRFSAFMPIVVCNYDSGNVLDQLESIIGPFTRPKVTSYNRSGSVMSAMVMQSISRDLGRPIYDASANKLRNFVEELFPGSANAVPDDLADRIKNDYRYENEKLRNTFGIDLDDPMNKPRRPSCAFSDSDISTAKSKLILELSERIDGNDSVIEMSNLEVTRKPERGGLKRKFEKKIRNLVRQINTAAAN